MSAPDREHLTYRQQMSLARAPALIIAAATFVVGILTALALVYSGSLPDEFAQTEATATVTELVDGPTVTEAISGPTVTVSATPTSADSAPLPTTPSISGAIDEIAVRVRDDDTVGDNLFEIGPHGWADPRFGWAGSKNGSRVESSTCQILAIATGPEEDLAQERSADCSADDLTYRVVIREPGDYTIVIKDQLTGIEGRENIKVVDS